MTCSPILRIAARLQGVDIGEILRAPGRARAPRRAFARSELLESASPDRAALDRVVDSHMSHLRRKLVEGGASGLIVAVRGLGYRLLAEP